MATATETVSRHVAEGPTRDQVRNALVAEKFALDCYLREKAAWRPYVIECALVWHARRAQRIALQGLWIEAQDRAAKSLLGVLDRRVAELARDGR